jgi:hypothetical protein
MVVRVVQNLCSQDAAVGVVEGQIDRFPETVAEI